MTDNVAEILPIHKEDIIPQVQLIQEAAKNTLASIQSRQDGLQFLFDAKFMKIGNNPQLKGKEDNLIEQINQSLTLLTTYWILYQYAGKKKFFKANLGARNGTDLEIYNDKNNTNLPEDIFEIFAATDPYQNDKLLKDIKTITERPNGNKSNLFVCFCSPQCFNTSRKTYKEMPIVWNSNIPDIEEGKEYGCSFNGKSIKIKWIRPETLRSWTADILKIYDICKIDSLQSFLQPGRSGINLREK